MRVIYNFAPLHFNVFRIVMLIMRRALRSRSQVRVHRTLGRAYAHIWQKWRESQVVPRSRGFLRGRRLHRAFPKRTLGRLSSLLCTYVTPSIPEEISRGCRTRIQLLTPYIWRSECALNVDAACASGNARGCVCNISIFFIYIILHLAIVIITVINVRAQFNLI